MMKKAILSLPMFIAAMAALIATPVSAATDSSKTIVETAVEAGSFKTLAAALQAADLVGTLQGEGPFTVFAPTDDAFAALPEGTVETLLKPENKGQLQGVLTYHVVAGEKPASEVVDAAGLQTVNGQRVDISKEDGKVMVDGATVVKTDIQCSNGVIHVIDAVILPESKNLPEVAEQAGAFGTLLAAVNAAGLGEALSGEGPFTVFAPTDEAFAKLPKGTVESLLKPENKEKLQAILKYHVVEGRVYSEGAVEAGSAGTLQGGSLKISVDDGQAMVNNANIVATDIDASNGVIHVIDSVLLPGQESRKAAQAPAQVIEHAMAEGEKLAASGDTAGCVQVYKTAAHEVISMQSPCSVRSTLTTAMSKADSCGCVHSQSYALKTGLEDAHAKLASAGN